MLNVSVASSTSALINNNVSVACTCSETNTGNNGSSDLINVIQLIPITLQTSPSGLQVSGDGGTTFYTAPHTFNWSPGSPQSILTTSPQSGGTGILYVWLNWSDSGAISHSISTPALSTTYTATFGTQYLLTTTVNNSAGGSISPTSAFLDAGTQVPITATANQGYQFLGFSGTISGTTNPQTLTLNAAASVTANFGLITQTSMSAQTNPSVFGAQVALTATVTSSSTPTSGNVTFYDGLNILGIAPVNASGVATLKTILLGNGARSLTARYDGVSTTYAPSVSAAVSQTVNAAAADGYVEANGSPVAAGPNPFNEVVGDFNGDGIADLAVANGDSGTVTILLGNGSGGFTAAGNAVQVGGNPHFITVGDFNNDGIQDLAVTDNTGNKVDILIGDGLGGFTVIGSISGVPHNPTGIVAGDFNGDGNTDLAFLNLNGNLAIFMGDGAGHFTQYGALIPVPQGAWAIVAADFNGDGKIDLATANAYDSSVSILIGDGAGGFTASGNPISVGDGPDGIVAGDFNNDGKIDLATANSNDSTVTILIGNGSGGFTRSNISPAVGGTPTWITAGDFNGDGKLDLAVANSSDNNVTVLIGNGSGAFTAESVNPQARSNPTGVVAADFNGDGRTDLAVTNEYGNNVTILLGADTATQMSTNASTTPQSATVGTAFGNALSVTLLDAFNNPVSGVQVTFTAPTASGIASGTFTSNQSSVVVSTGMNGVASAPAFTANAVTGSYMVTATAGSLTQNFSLTNNPETAPVLAASFLTSPISVNTNSQLQFTITNPPGNAVPLSGVAFSDTLPSGLTIGSGTLSQCGGTLTLASPTSITLSGATVAVGAQCVFAVTVTGATQGSYSTTTSAVTAANASTGDAATAALTVNGGDLSITKSHAGNFTQGDTGDTYTITVKNVGSGPTDGSTITVTDTVPAGLTPTGPTGLVNGWYCGIALQIVTCTRMEILLSNSSYPPLPVTVNVASNALPSLTNMATVAGGGDINPNNNMASDSTTIIQVVNITVTSNIAGPTVTVDNGTPFTGSQTFTWVVGSNHTLATSTPQSGGTGIQYVWAGWSDSGAISHSIAVPSTATTYTANFQTQYLLTTAVNPTAGGSISPGTEYVNPGTQAPVSVTANSGYQLLGFSGALNGTTNPQTVTVNAPTAVTANFGLITQTSLTAQPNPSIFGAGVTLTATVTSSSTPTSGTVTFYDGTSILEIKPVNSSGVATLTTILLGDGARSLTARYEGGSVSMWAPSVSAAVSQTVNAQQADGFLQASGSPIAVGTGPATVAIGDFNGDGIADLAIANSNDNTVQVLMGNIAGGFTARSPIGVGSDPVSIAVGDFNGDGKPDLAVANYNDKTLTILLGDGLGGFAVTGSPIGVGDNPDALGVADFNGDGVADIAVLNRANGTVIVLLGNGSAGFPQSRLSPLAGFPVAIAAGDFNGDGNVDVAIADEADSHVVIMLGDGTGRLTVGSRIAVGADPKSIVAGDFNGDGKLDLATANNGSNNVTILLGDGMGGFAATNISPAAGTQPNGITAGDFNGDGKLDLAVANHGSNNVSILIGDGSGAFTAESVSPAAGTNPVAIAVGDFNGDGRSDLATANYGGNNVTILLGVDTPTQINTNANTTPQSATVGTAFGTALSVTLLDAFNNPVPNVQVTFTAPSGSGIVSGTFTGNLTSVQEATGPNGVATAPTFTANAVTGQYMVTATAGALSANFSMTNNPQAAPSIAASFLTSPIPLNTTSQLQFTITNPVGNAVPLSGVAFSDTLPTGLTVVTGTSSACGGTLTLTSPTSISFSGGTVVVGTPCEFTVTVTGATAGTYNFSTTAVTATNANTGNTASANLTVHGADLTIAKSHTGNFTQNDTGDTYTITVKNVGSGPTDGSTVTMSDTLPTGLTPTGPTGSYNGWSCGIASQTVTCTRSDVLTANNSYPSITVTVNVSSTAASLLTNTATVAGGADINLNNNSASDPTTIIQVVKITVATNLSGPTVTVDNGSPFTGSQTFTWVVASNHTIATGTPQSGGTGVQYVWQSWSDSGAISHSIQVPPAAATYTANFQTQYLLTTAVTPSGEGIISPATGYVNAGSIVPVSATANSTYVFTGFSGGLSGATTPQNLTMSGPMSVTANFETGPDPTIAENYNGSFRQGDVGDTYTITVTNLGQDPTGGALQWVDTLPAGLTATGLSGPAGWTCTLGTLTCSTSNPLGGGASAIFTLTVKVANNAASSITNVVTVSGGGDVHLNNDTASLPTPVIQVADLTVTKTHSGSFVQGQSGTYTIVVNNVGPGPTVGTVTVTDTLPTGLAVLSMSGSGWTCNTSTATCTRSSALASNASYPAITLTVLVGGNAPASVTNTAHVSGGGELNTSNDTATDPTTIIQTVQVTITTSPANLLVTVDGTSAAGPRTFTWNVGDSHTIATSTPQGSLTFLNWSDGGAISHNITVSTATTYTATFH